MKNISHIFTLGLILITFSTSLISQIGIHSAFPFIERDYEYIDTNSRSMAEGVKMITYYLDKNDFETNENPPDAFKIIIDDTICAEYGIGYSENYSYTVRNYENGAISDTNIQFDDRRILTSYYQNGNIRKCLSVSLPLNYLIGLSLW